MKLHTIAAAAALGSLPATAMAAPGQCLTRPEAQALVSFVLPDVVGAAATRCAPLAGTNSYLARTANLAARFAPIAQQSGPLARVAAGKSFGLPPGLAGMKDDDLRGLLRGVLGDKMTSLKAKDCAQIDEVMATLDPMPPANLARMIVLLLDYSGSDRKGGPLSICKS